MKTEGRELYQINTCLGYDVVHALDVNSAMKLENHRNVTKFTYEYLEMSMLGGILLVSLI